MSSFLASSRCTARRRLCLTRSYAAKAKPTIAPVVAPAAPTYEQATTGLSSCPPNTVLTGLNYLKDQEPVLALADEEYPPWLWTILQPKEYPDDGPGGRRERWLLNKANTQKIKDDNFMKTQ